MGVVRSLGAEENVVSINGGGLYDSITNAPTIDGTYKKHGSYAYRFYKTSASTCYITDNISGSPTTYAASFYIYFNGSLPAAYCNLFTFNATAATPTFAYEPTGTKVLWGFSGIGANYSSAISANTWYLIDIKVYTGAGTQTIDCQINGVAQTQYSSTSAQSTITAWRIGGLSSTTFDIYVDDIVTCTDDMYPVGEHECKYLRPNADGTHNAGTNTIEAQDGTDIGTTTAYDKLNSSTPDATTYVKQVTQDTTKYAEIDFGAMTSGKTPLGVEAFLAYTSAGTQANAAACYGYLSSTEYVIWGTSGTRSDYSDGSTSNLYFKSTTQGITLSETNVNALRVRLGHGADINPVPYWIDVWLVVVEVTSSQQVAVGQSTEAETAQAIAWAPKKRLAAQATETETAQALTRRKVVAVGQATEAETAQAIAARKTIVVSVGQATEADSSQAIAWTPKKRLVGQAAEAETSQAFEREKEKLLGQATEAETSQALTRRKVRSAGQAAEVETSQAMSRRKVRAVGQAAEAETSQAMSGRKLAAVSQAGETDTAQSIVKLSGAKYIAVGQATEAETAQALAKRKTKVTGQSAESESAQAIRAARAVAIGQATEADTAQSISTEAPIIVALGQAVEVDLATMFNYASPPERTVYIGAELRVFNIPGLTEEELSGAAGEVIILAEHREVEVENA